MHHGSPMGARVCVETTDTSGVAVLGSMLAQVGVIPIPLRRELDQSGLITISPANVDAINARLAAVGYPGPRIATGVYSNPLHSTNLLAKVEHQVNGRDQVVFRYSLYDAASENARNAIGPAVSIAGVASFGRLSNSPTGRVNRLSQAVVNLAHQAGGHSFRAGVDFLHNDNVIVFPRAIRGAYTFSSLANFLAGTYNNAGFTQTFGATDVSQANPNVGLYGQDEWKVRPTVTLNLGVRYDLQFLETITTDTNNVSPRVGVAWSPFIEGSTVVRASAGLFYDRVPLRALANALLSAGNSTDLARLRQIGVSLSPAQTGAPVFPNVLPALVPSVTLPTLATMDRALQNGYSQQASAEVEQQLRGRMTVGLTYQYLRARHLLMSINQNGMVQGYSALPMNITSGVTTIQGTAGRPIVNGTFIDRNAGEGSTFFTVNARVSRVLKMGRRAELEPLIEAFNLTNHTNVLTRNGNFGAGPYPFSPAATFGEITAVGDPRTVQLGLRARF